MDNQLKVKRNIPLSLVTSLQLCHVMLTKLALFSFGIALWSKWSSLPVGILLTFIWLLDGGLSRLSRMIKEPFVLAILIMCGLLALGILWGDHPEAGYPKWKRYFAFLVFVPYLSLLNKDRLPWAISGLLIGYFGVLLIGFYQWAVVGVQGIPPLRISYLSFSSMLGIGVILTIYLAGINRDIKIKAALWLLGTFLMFLQFNQNARGALLATLLSTLLLIVLLYRSQIRNLIGIASILITAILIFAFNSSSFQERVMQIQKDAENIQQDKYDTSLGYRLAIWDVGLYGIKQQPLTGYGTGKAGGYFEETIITYKEGRYKDLSQHIRTSHYHNDWIEIGMHIGMPGVLAFAFLLLGWFLTMRAYQLAILGTALVCFVFLSGLTDTFALYSKIPTLLIVITAVAISWQKEQGITANG